ncbi:hypothetical protein HK102_005172 [Quaeritorhiza haematococci]|nr:hypothetical protein HK102_005172 [Quaeritorhiza haematococci]
MAEKQQMMNGYYGKNPEERNYASMLPIEAYGNSNGNVQPSPLNRSATVASRRSVARSTLARSTLKRKKQNDPNCKVNEVTVPLANQFYRNVFALMVIPNLITTAICAAPSLSDSLNNAIRNSSQGSLFPPLFAFIALLSLFRLWYQAQDRGWNVFLVVMLNIFYSLTFMTVEVFTNRTRMFVTAFATAAGHFAILALFCCQSKIPFKGVPAYILSFVATGAIWGGLYAVWPIRYLPNLIVAVVGIFYRAWFTPYDATNLLAESVPASRPAQGAIMFYMDWAFGIAGFIAGIDD